jgi:hypothetical protein
MTKRETIIRAVVAALEGNAGGVPVHRGVDTSNATDTYFSVYPSEQGEQISTAVNRNSGKVERHLFLVVRAAAPGTDEDVDPLLEAMLPLVMSNAAVIPKVVSIEEQRVTWEFAENAETSWCICETVFDIRYTTRSNDLTIG